ncbi:TAXI family TRAP transporter solute-binding subunit [Sphingomonas hengshuiensis]|uniref:TAXI family TRAP transporter solute-binding subunit n=1 Tax=Sphingomonas hengshuiensis TaxID=1609977 RepID=UPI000AAA9B7E|nr:TAXI family TRAP transporter solute-binding subunit [Sphingomonas hengshuiensis]
MIRRLLLALCLSVAAAGSVAAQPASPPPAPGDESHWQEVGATGFATKRLVLASACAEACPWGELGEFVRDAMKPAGYEIILCRNCNRTEGPRIVAEARFPPPLVDDDLRHGTVKRIKARIDFGITEASMMKWAYEGKFIYAKDGPYPNLRLIARIEDPTYLLVAVKPGLGITSLAEIRERRLPVRILTWMQPSEAPVLDYYGLDRESLKSWGASIVTPKDVTAETPFDVIISSLASPANNPESSFWTKLTVYHDLDYLELPQDLRDQMVAKVDMVHTVARWGVLPGVDRNIASVGRSGEVVFARDDMPDDMAYAAAKAIDENRGELKWFVRPYSIDPRTVGDGKGVPLHPGAARYYREKGYIK